MQQYAEGRQMIGAHHPYYLEDGPPATIMEVNSNEYTEQTESVLPGEEVYGRHSPFNKDGYYKYPVPQIAGVMHR